jgi:hypothetical protein
VPWEGISRILSMITGHRVAMCSVWGVPVSFVGDAYAEGHSPAARCRKGLRVPDRGEQVVSR